MNNAIMECKDHTHKIPAEGCEYVHEKAQLRKSKSGSVEIVVATIPVVSNFGWSASIQLWSHNHNCCISSRNTMGMMRSFAKDHPKASMFSWRAFLSIVSRLHFAFVKMIIAVFLKTHKCFSIVVRLSDWAVSDQVQQHILLQWALEMSRGLELAGWLTSAAANKIPPNWRKHIQLRRGFSIWTNKKAGISSRRTSDAKEMEGNLSTESIPTGGWREKSIRWSRCYCSSFLYICFCPFLPGLFQVLNKFSFDFTAAACPAAVVQNKLLSDHWIAKETGRRPH